MILNFVTVLGPLPTTAFATGINNVYLSVSCDGKYINDKKSGICGSVDADFLGIIRATGKGGSMQTRFTFILELITAYSASVENRRGQSAEVYV